MAYATEQELADFFDMEKEDLPDDTEQLLEKASVLVDYYTLSRAEEGDPVKEAVFYQVEFWWETGDSTGVMDQIGELAIGSFRMSLRETDAAVLSLAPMARRTLFKAGLLYRGVECR